MDGNIKLPNCWKSRLQEEFDQKYMHDIKVFLANELSKGKVIYPPINKIFEALNLTLFEENRISFSKGCYRGQEIIARMHYLNKKKVPIILLSSVEKPEDKNILSETSSKVLQEDMFLLLRRFMTLLGGLKAMLSLLSKL